MPLPLTNLSLNAIHIEVGGTSGTQVSLNDADVRGIGSTDPTYDGGDGINQTSGTQISIGEFRNAQDLTFTLSAISPSIYDYAGSGTATAGLRVGADGYIYALGSETPVNSASSYVQMNTSTDWIIPRTGMSSYYVYAIYSGDTMAGTFSSYLALSSDRTFTLSNSSSGTTKSSSLTIAIWDNNTGSGSALASRTYSLAAERG